MASADLKQQFAQLQEQQAKKLQRRQQIKSAKAHEKEKPTVNTAASVAFGIEDDLDLKLADPPPRSEGIYSEELVQNLQEQLRELKDETGRLYKLLSERDMELRQLRKKRETEKAALGVSGVTNDTAATKIVDLSKKVRELTAELESEKTKAKQWARKCGELEREVGQTQSGGVKKSVNSTATDASMNGEDKSSEVDVKAVQDKLKSAELKVADFRNQCQALKQELKVAHKVIANEVGEEVPIHSLLNSSTGWRGRTQQIMALQKKVQDLKNQVEQQSQGSQAEDVEEDFMGSSSSRKSNAEDRHRDQLKKMDRERKEQQERQVADMKALEQDNETLKQKADASKARNKVLTNEIKSLKQQLQTLLEKGKHDDELIDALMKQQTKLKDMLNDRSNQQKHDENEKEDQLKELAFRTQHDNNIVQHLKAIVAEKEAKVRALEEEVNHMKLTTSNWPKESLQKAQMNGVNALFERAASRASCSPSAMNQDDGTILTSPTPGPGSARSDRSVSRHSAVGDRSDRPTSRKSSARPGSAGVNKGAMEELNTQCQEYKALSQAAQVEKDKLAELVKVLQSRLDEAMGQVVSAQNEAQSHKRKNVQLEKQLGKVKVEQQSAKGVKGKSAAKPRVSVTASGMAEVIGDDDSRGMGNLEELHTSLTIQKDENEALKAALQSTLKAKAEDLRLYNEIMEETKQVFLQGLRQYRQGQT